MRSLYSGVSGLQNHQTRMDVIGNNISNVNTTGFKKNRVIFQDMLYQTLSGAARPREEVGGVDPKQVGLGMTIASIDTVHTQGSLQTTGKADDVAINGSGFFVLRKGDQLFYTRDGSFGIDEEGMFVNPANGMRVQGWLAETVDGVTTINTSAELEDLVIPVGSKDPAASTSIVELACNLNKNLPEIPPGATLQDVNAGTRVVTYNIYDSMGNTHQLRVEFTKVVGETNQWQAAVTVDPDSETPTNTLVNIGGVDPAPSNVFTLEFSNDGTLLQVTDAAGDAVDAGELAVDVSFDVLQATPPVEGGPPLRQDFQLNLGDVGSFVDSMTQYASPTSTKVFAQNGYGMGYLESFRIDQSGIITGVFSNGTNRPLGQIALGSFTNPGGLEKVGENNFVETINSGIADIGPSGIAGKGKVIAGTLEMSNVDLAEQFTDMIVTQRGFQANSRTITTSDQMLQELLNLKR